MFQLRAAERFLQPSSMFSTRPLDRSVVWGLVICAALIGVGILSSGKTGNFIDFPSLLIVVGGTLGATMVHYSIADLQNAYQALRDTLAERIFRPRERIRAIVELANGVRRDGLLTLETAAEQTRDSFLKKALELVVDGRPADEIRRTLEIELQSSEERNARTIQVFDTMGAYAPAMGLIGTLIGLIEMLGSLSDPSKVGPAMSVALITTFYGALLANIVFLPIAGKLRLRSNEGVTLKRITIDGAVALAAQENSIVIEQRLECFLPQARG